MAEEKQRKKPGPKPGSKKKPGQRSTPEEMALKVLGKQGYGPGRRGQVPVTLPHDQVVRNCERTLQIAYLPKIDTKDAEQVRARCLEYFRICAEDDAKPTIPGLALALGVDRNTMLKWRSGYTKRPPEVVEELNRAYAIINAEMESLMLDGAVQPLSGIFLMKNNMGYSDRTEIEVRPGDNVNDGLSREELNAKYADSIVVVDDAEPAEGAEENK